MEEEKKSGKSLVFALNGERFELPEVDPSLTLLEFLRTNTKYKGAKLGCGEGGCGACVVLLSKFDPISKQVQEFSISSCLTLLCSIHLSSVTTSEGLGNTKDGFHSIHQRFSGFHASQCGFCTPGMCMSFYSALAKAEKSNRPEPPSGFSKLTVSEAEKAIAGNLCRCTGYRPIVDACKSFASDVDMEDLGLNSFWRENAKEASLGKLPVYDCAGVNTFPDFLKAEIEESFDGSKGTLSNFGCWYHPSSLDKLKDLMKLLNSEGKKRVKLVVGNTCSGVYKDNIEYDNYIDLKGIPELSVIKKDCSGIELGATITISQAAEVLKEEKENIVFCKIADHLDKVASHFVRNMASLGGNLIMAQRYGFASDIATILVTANTSVVIQKNSERLVLTLEEFLTKSELDSGFLLLSIRIPQYKIVTEESKLMFETYRASPRPLGNAVAYVNAAFLAEVSTPKESESATIKNVIMVFGAFGSDHATRARNVEKYLVGKSVTVPVVLEAIKLVREVVIPKEGTTKPAYRTSLAVSFLFDFLHPFVEKFLAPSENLKSDSCGDGKTDITFDAENHIVNEIHSCARPLDRTSDKTTLISGRQSVKFSRDYLPVGEPTKKAGVDIQASGEAVYVDDIPSPKDCLHGAFVYSTKALAEVKGINFADAKKFTSFITAKDIPIGGKNLGSRSIYGEATLFAESITQHAGEPLGLVLAETQRLANTVAAQAEVDYCTENVGSPILSVDEAVQNNSFFEVPLRVMPKQVGNFSEGMEKADLKILSAELNFGSQYHFYMETQTALAIPDEDNCMVVYSSCQNPMGIQYAIAKCIGVPIHNVRVITRRVGGGFGGKSYRSMPVSTACALAAYKLGRPVRMYLDRKTDMIITGGRHPMKVSYSIGFKHGGKITALDVDILMNAGISEDVSPLLPSLMNGSLKKYDWGALSVKYRVCKTNLTSKSIMRAPGEVQGSFIAEAVIEHVASSLGMDSDYIRNVNLHSFESLELFHEGFAGEKPEYTLPCVMEKVGLTANFEQRVQTVKKFNSSNRWRKRGISRVPVVHPVSLYSKPGKVGVLNDGSIVVEVGGIELGQGLWTKVKQMVAFALGRLWEDGNENLLERVRIVQADSLSLIQGGATAGSTSSESSCEAARLACEFLVDRLMPVKRKLEEKTGYVSWDSLIFQAYNESVNLSASAYFVPEKSSSSYLNYGAAVSEVEIDLLTGATKILQTDLIYDCGQSLNPAVDLGQIEGCFVQGIGFFMLEEHTSNGDGLVTSDGTWTYKIPTVDTIPRKFNVEILNSGHHKWRVLSSKASGEPPLALAASIHCAIREAIREARKQLFSDRKTKGSAMIFQLPVPATMSVVKEFCGFDNIERYLETLISSGGGTGIPCKVSTK